MVDNVAAELFVYGRRSHAMTYQTDFEKCSEQTQDGVFAMVCGDNSTSGNEERGFTSSTKDHAKPHQASLK